MPRPEQEDALLLVRKAQEDADAVKKLLSDTDIADSVVRFNARTAERERRRGGLAAEARRLMKDEGYVREARDVAKLMETLRGPR